MEETIQYLQIITNVIIIILFIGISILVFSLIKTIKSISLKFSELSSQVTDIKTKLDPAIDKIQTLTENVNGVVSAVRDNIDVLGKSVVKIKDTVDDIVDFEKKVQSKIEPPIMETANTIAAVSVGVKTFFDAYKRKRIISDIDISDEGDEIKDKLKNANAELDAINTKLESLYK